MEPSNPPSDIKWDAPPAPPTPVAPESSGGHDIIWDDAKAANQKPSGWHTLQALAQSFGEGVKDTAIQGGKDAIRLGAKGVAALPLMAMDAGVGARNIAEWIQGNPPYELPSSMFETSLDQLVSPPASKTERLEEDILSGFLSPNPTSGASAALKSFSAARAADKALGTTLGQQTGSAALQGLEKTLSRLPGGGALVESVKKQTDKLADTTQGIVERLAGGADTSATGAGNVLNKQLKSAAKQLKEQAGGHFDEVERLIPKDTKVGVKSTLETLEKLTSTITGAENTSKSMVNPEMVAIKSNLEKDLSSAYAKFWKGISYGFNKDLEGQNLQGLPYHTLKELRTKVGGMIDWGPFSGDAKNGQLKQLYAALTADMNNGAASVSKEAAAAVKSANAQYAAIKEQEKILRSVLQKAGGPEKVFASLMNGTKEGGTVIKQVLASVDEPSRQILAASALQRMGRAAPGAQDAAGAVFSADTFLTNWNKMSPEARGALFGSLPGDYAKSISQLSANIESLKGYSKIIPNASNSAQAILWGGEVGAALMAVMTGNFKTAAGIAGSAAATKVLATALTNPQTAKWMAQKTGQMVVDAAKGVTVYDSDRKVQRE